jgi:hypothetical protein
MKLRNLKMYYIWECFKQIFCVYKLLDWLVNSLWFLTDVYSVHMLISNYLRIDLNLFSVHEEILKNVVHTV